MTWPTLWKAHMPLARGLSVLVTIAQPSISSSFSSDNNFLIDPILHQTSATPVSAMANTLAVSSSVTDHALVIPVYISQQWITHHSYIVSPGVVDFILPVPTPAIIVRCRLQSVTGYGPHQPFRSKRCNCPYQPYLTQQHRQHHSAVNSPKSSMTYDLPSPFPSLLHVVGVNSSNRSQCTLNGSLPLKRHSGSAKLRSHLLPK